MWKMKRKIPWEALNIVKKYAAMFDKVDWLISIRNPKIHVTPRRMERLKLPLTHDLILSGEYYT
jgi:hypothetical protein